MGGGEEVEEFEVERGWRGWRGGLPGKEVEVWVAVVWGGEEFVGYVWEG